MTPANNGLTAATSMQEFDSSERDYSGLAGRVPPIEASPELRRFLAEIKGQAQFLLYLADQIDESLEQLTHETDRCHSAFLCKILGMYSNQLETKHQGLGEKIAEACQEVYVTVREHEQA
jgi:hypothetical protein